MASIKKKMITTEWMDQPVDYDNEQEGTFRQRISIFKPEKAKDFSPVFVILGNEGPLTDKKLNDVYENYGSPSDVIFFRIEHRGYGQSISQDEDQSIPKYVNTKDALRDYHRVITKYKRKYTGPWIAGGFSYGGGVSINFGYSYPEDVVGIHSSSGVVDWSFFMDTYDAQVRLNLGKEIYTRLMYHTENLKPEKVFDQKWKDRELCLAYATGFSQYTTYEALFPLFKFLLKFKTKNFIRALKFIDRAFAQRGATQYMEGNSKLTLSRKEALTEQFSWRYWRWQQFSEAGVFWKSSEDVGIYQRSLEDLKEECRLLFKMNPPLLENPVWDVKRMAEELKVPLIYVNGGRDPWKGVCLPPDFSIKEGKYFYFPEGKHCPDGVDKNYGGQVFKEIRKLFNANIDNPDLFLKPTKDDAKMIQPEEYVERRNTLKAAIKAQGLDAFLVSEPGSIYYYTGATYKAQERPFLIVMWPDKDPTFLVPKLEEDHMKKAKIGNVKAYWEFPAPPGQGWPEILEEILSQAKLLGVETGINVENLSRLHYIETKPLDLTDKQRLVKTPGEIEMIRQAAMYSDMGMAKMMEKAYYGISVLEMFGIGRKIQMEVIKTGQFDPLNCEFLSAFGPWELSDRPQGVPPTEGK